MKNKLSLGLLTIFISCLPANSAPSAAHTPEEQYAMYKKLHDRLMSGEKRKSLEDTLPNLGSNIEKAAKISRARWARSKNYDEFAKAEILPLKVLQGLGISEDRDQGIGHVSAGIMHTYGYLFSTLETPYGLKSKRWVESRLDERLGLEKGMFGPTPPKGEFLKNLTDALGSLIMRKNTKNDLKGIYEERVEWLVPSNLKAKTASILKLKNAAGLIKRTAVIKTYFYELNAIEGATFTDSLLLVYRIQFQDEGHRPQTPLFVTAFPVNEQFMKGLAEASKQTSVFQPRYNLYIDPEWKVVKYENFGFH